MVKSIIRAYIQGFMKFGPSLGNIINTITLSIVYFIGVGITSIIAKVVGKKFLDLDATHKPSYWITHKTTTRKKEDYYNPF